jgi:transcriptional regulator with XRE-family HTH domain
MSDHAAANLRRLMAAGELSTQEVAQRSGLDERTVRGIVRGTHRPHPRTLHRLARGLSVSVDEFFIAPVQLLYRRFDRQTNPVVQEVLQGYPHLFAGWGEADFDELHSRVGSGGPLTFEGALAAVHAMNRKRDLHEKLDVLLESGQSRTVGGILDLIYEQVVVGAAGQEPPQPPPRQADN